MALFKVEICGVNTSKLPLLTEDEKKELFKEIKKGNEVAREKYIRGNLRLVLSILQRFSNMKQSGTCFAFLSNIILTNVDSC